MKRNRAEGWRHAKISGHKNEDMILNKLDIDLNFRQTLLNQLEIKDMQVSVNLSSGLNEKNIPSVLDRGTTKSKTDLKLQQGNRNFNISVKKSLSGQAYLVKAEHFIKAYQIQFGEQIPCVVTRAIKLFWSADPEQANEILDKLESSIDKRQLKVQRNRNNLNAQSLLIYDEQLYHSLQNWLIQNIKNITLLVFSRGAAKNSDDWAEYIWYKNHIDHESNYNYIYKIDDLAQACQNFSSTETIKYGSKNGGTTISLPFGFVQWHQGQMQFHHQYNKISLLLNSTPCHNGSNL